MDPGRRGDGGGSTPVPYNPARDQENNSTRGFQHGKPGDVPGTKGSSDLAGHARQEVELMPLQEWKERLWSMIRSTPQPKDGQLFEPSGRLSGAEDGLSPPVTSRADAIGTSTGQNRIGRLPENSRAELTGVSESTVRSVTDDLDELRIPDESFTAGQKTYASLELESVSIATPNLTGGTDQSHTLSSTGGSLEVTGALGKVADSSVREVRLEVPASTLSTTDALVVELPTFGTGLEDTLGIKPNRLNDLAKENRTFASTSAEANVRAAARVGEIAATQPSKIQAEVIRQSGNSVGETVELATFGADLEEAPLPVSAPAVPSLPGFAQGGSGGIVEIAGAITKGDTYEVGRESVAKASGAKLPTYGIEYGADLDETQGPANVPRLAERAPAATAGPAVVEAPEVAEIARSLNRAASSEAARQTQNVGETIAAKLPNYGADLEETATTGTPLGMIDRTSPPSAPSANSTAMVGDIGGTISKGAIPEVSKQYGNSGDAIASKPQAFGELDGISPSENVISASERPAPSLTPGTPSAGNSGIAEVAESSVRAVQSEAIKQSGGIADPAGAKQLTYGPNTLESSSPAATGTVDSRIASATPSSGEGNLMAALASAPIKGSQSDTLQGNNGDLLTLGKQPVGVDGAFIKDGTLSSIVDSGAAKLIGSAPELPGLNAKIGSSDGTVSSSISSPDQAVLNPNVASNLAGRSSAGQLDPYAGLQTSSGASQAADGRGANASLTGNERLVATAVEPKGTTSDAGVTSSRSAVGPGVLTNAAEDGTRLASNNPNSAAAGFGTINSFSARSSVEGGVAGNVTALPQGAIGAESGAKSTSGTPMSVLASGGHSLDAAGQMTGLAGSSKGLAEGMQGIFPGGKIPGEVGAIGGTGIASTTKTGAEVVGKLGEPIPAVPGTLVGDKGVKTGIEVVGGKTAETDKTGKIETPLAGINKTLLPGEEDDGKIIKVRREGVLDGDPEVRLQAFLNNIKKVKGKGDGTDDEDEDGLGVGQTDPFGNSLNTQGQILGVGGSATDPDPTKTGTTDPNAVNAGGAPVLDPSQILPDLELFDSTKPQVATDGVALPADGIVREPSVQYDSSTIGGFGQVDAGGTAALLESGNPILDPGVPNDGLRGDDLDNGLPEPIGVNDGVGLDPGEVISIDRKEVIDVGILPVEDTETNPIPPRYEDSENGVVSSSDDISPEPERRNKEPEDKKDEGIVGRIESLMETLLTDMATGRSVEDEESRVLIDKLFEIGEEEREQYVAYAGDTIESVARRKLKDRRFAPLLYTINRRTLGAISDFKTFELKAGTVLQLPSMAEALRYKVHVLGDKKTLLVYVNTHKEASSGSATEFNKPVSYTCRLGDTLETVAQRHPIMQDASLWRLIAKVNNLSSACDANGQPKDKLKRGTILRLPTAVEIEDYKKTVVDQSLNETIPQLTHSVLANKTFSADPLRNTGAGLTLPLPERRLVESRVITQTDLGEGNTSLLLRLEVKTKNEWKPVAEYVVNEGASGLRLYNFRGSSKNIRISLPTRAARELAENDLTVNAAQYCAKFLAANSAC